MPVALLLCATGFSSACIVQWDTYTNISVGNISSPTDNGVYCVNSEVTCSIGSASDIDHRYDPSQPVGQRDTYPADTFNNSDAYTWSSGGVGSWKNGDYTGQSVVWIAPSTPQSSVTITCTIKDDAVINDNPYVGTRNDTDVQRSVTVYVVQVTMTNPAGDPTLSEEAQEGVNEFTFSSANPGVCDITCTATITPSNQNTRDWAEQNVSWSISPGISGSQLSFVDDDKGLSVIIRFTGLPSDNSELGSKTVSVTACSQQQSNPVEVFFARDATNNPGGIARNWYHYWIQTGAYFGSVGLDLNRSAAYTDYINGQWLAFLGVDSDNDDTILDGPDPPYGDLFTSIDIFAWRCRHEARHVVTNSAWDWWPGGYESNRDLDSDGMPDDVEASFGPAQGGPFYEILWDSDSDELRDVEDYVCWTQSAWAQHYADDQDWAATGNQY